MSQMLAGLDEVAARDAKVAAVLADHGPPPEVRSHPPGFEGLLRIIVGQQISSAAARGIWRRIEAAVVPMAPASFLDVAEREPALLGLSRQKLAYGCGLASAVDGGSLDLDGLHRLGDDDAIAAITALKGFGRWSAEIYLLFSMGRRDIWPADDLAVRVGVQRMLGLDERPDRATMDAAAEPWRPWRGPMAMLMWHYYHRLGNQKQFDDRAPAKAPPKPTRKQKS